MTTVTKNRVTTLQQFGGVPYGNSTKLDFLFETNSSGVFADSDSSSAVGNGDVVRLGVLPAGIKLIDSLAIVSAAFTASTTANIGFAYVDGSDDSDVPQDDDYFNSALNTASAGRTVAGNTAVAPVTLPKDAYLILTVGGAAHASAGRMDVIIEGVLTGTP